MKRRSLSYMGLFVMTILPLLGQEYQKRTPSVSPVKLLVSAWLLGSAYASGPRAFFCAHGQRYSSVCSHYQAPFELDYSKLPLDVKKMCHRTPECLTEPSDLEGYILKNKYNMTGSTIVCRAPSSWNGN